MIRDFIRLFSKENWYLIPESLGKGILIALLGSALFATINWILFSIFEVAKFTFIIAFVCTFIPVTFCVALLTLRLQTKYLEDIKHKLRFIILEGTLLGGFVSLSIGLLFSFLWFLVLLDIGRGTMQGVTFFTILAIIIGAFMGGLTAFILVKPSLNTALN